MSFITKNNILQFIAPKKCLSELTKDELIQLIDRIIDARTPQIDCSCYYAYKWQPKINFHARKTKYYIFYFAVLQKYFGEITRDEYESNKLINRIVSTCYI